MRRQQKHHGALGSEQPRRLGPRKAYPAAIPRPPNSLLLLCAPKQLPAPSHLALLAASLIRLFDFDWFVWLVGRSIGGLLNQYWYRYVLTAPLPPLATHCSLYCPGCVRLLPQPLIHCSPSHGCTHPLPPLSIARHSPYYIPRTHRHTHLLPPPSALHPCPCASAAPPAAAPNTWRSCPWSPLHPPVAPLLPPLLPAQ